MCKAEEIEENNRMGRTRNLLKKLEDITGRFHVRMGMVKDKCGKGLTEALGTKHSWQGHTDELCRKVLMTQMTPVVWSLTWSQTSWGVKLSGP